MNEPLVSIITPVYNSEEFLSETIKSIQNQTYKNWRLLLVDDCSKDNSSEIIKSFRKEDARIKYIKLEKNSGAAVSRNVGIKNAEGRFIAFVDSDDLWDSRKLEIQIEYMLKENVGFSFTSYRYMRQDGSKRIRLQELLRKLTMKDYLEIL